MPAERKNDVRCRVVLASRVPKLRAAIREAMEEDTPTEPYPQDISSKWADDWQWTGPKSEGLLDIEAFGRDLAAP